MWILADVQNPGISALITPYLPLIGIIAGGILLGAFNVWNRRRGAVETRAPDVNEIWKQQAEQSAELDAERKMRRRLEDYARDLKRAFLSYFWRVSRGGTIEPTQFERKYLEADPPTRETPHTP